MRLLVTMLSLAALAFATPAEAQKNCRKGIPCGNSCIAANKTCRIGQSAPAPAHPAPLAAMPKGKSDTAPTTSGAWVGSSRGSTYYRAGCSGASKLSRSNRIYFKSEEAARAAGYRRSSQRGC